MPQSAAPCNVLRQRLTVLVASITGYNCYSYTSSGGMEGWVGLSTKTCWSVRHSHCKPCKRRYINVRTFNNRYERRRLRSRSLCHCSQRRTDLHRNYYRKRLSDIRGRKKETIQLAELQPMTLCHISVSHIGVRAKFFSGRLSHLCPKKFQNISTAPEKNCFLTNQHAINEVKLFTL